MKKLYIIYIVLLFIFGCKSKDKKYDNIEFMAYTYGYNVPGESLNVNGFFIRSKFYVLINESGNAKMIVQNFYPTCNKSYFDLNIDKKIIDDLADSLLKLKAYNRLIRPGVYLYCGPSLKIRLSKNNETKTVCFHDSHYNEAQIYVNFYHHIDSLIEFNKLTVTKDTTYLLKRRSDFINWSFNIDTILHPLPKIEVDNDVSDKPLIVKQHQKHPKKY